MTDDYRTIPLTRGKVAKVDPEDFKWLSLYKWHCMASGGYAARRHRKRSEGDKKLVRMHNEIMQPPPGMEVDHKNGDPLDNRRSNLRICTRVENCRNGPRRRGSSSIYKGVGLGYKGYRVFIKGPEGYLFLDGFESEIVAACAYDHYARKLHGEFARTNFPYDAERDAEAQRAIASLRRRVKTSQHVGVTILHDGRATARVKTVSGWVHIGTFPTEHEAVAARQKVLSGEVAAGAFLYWSLTVRSSLSELPAPKARSLS